MIHHSEFFKKSILSFEYEEDIEFINSKLFHLIIENNEFISDNEYINIELKKLSKLSIKNIARKANIVRDLLLSKFIPDERTLKLTHTKYKHLILYDFIIDSSKDTIDQYKKQINGIAKKWKRIVPEFSLHAAHLNGEIGSHSYQSIIIDDNTARLIRERDAANFEFMNTRVAKRNGTVLSLSQDPDRAIRRFNETYAVIKALEHRAKLEMKTYLFITMTAPPEFHPSPKNESKKWNFCSVKEGNKVILELWDSVKRRLAKRNIRFNEKEGFHHIYGMRVVEPHKDGCPHHHALLFLNPIIVDKVSQVFRSVFNFSETAVDIKVEDSTRKDAASAASYCTKYLLKSYNLDVGEVCVRDEGNKQVKIDSLDAVMLWRKALSLRSYALIGVQAKLEKFRALRSLKDLVNDTSDELAKLINITYSSLNPDNPKFHQFLEHHDSVHFEKIETPFGIRKVIRDKNITWLCNKTFTVESIQPETILVKSRQIEIIRFKKYTLIISIKDIY